MRTAASFLIALMVLTGCPKKEAAAPAPAPAPAAPAVAAKEPVKEADTVEVEFFGAILPGKATGVAKMIFVAMQEPCLPLPAEAHPYGKDVVQEKLFAEFFPPQGSQGHLCVYGLNAAGQIVASATYAKNPVTFQGEGEVIFGNVNVTLEPLPAPAPLPKGL